MRSLRDRLCSMALLTGALLWAPAPALAQSAPALDPRAILQILERIEKQMPIYEQEE